MTDRRGLKGEIGTNTLIEGEIKVFNEESNLARHRRSTSKDTEDHRAGRLSLGVNHNRPQVKSNKSRWENQEGTTLEGPDGWVSGLYNNKGS